MADVVAPHIDDVRLVDLVDADVSIVEPGEYYEGRRFVDGDIAGRDISAASFSECEFDGLDAGQATLRGARFTETVLARVSAPAFFAGRTQWRDVRLERSRLGAAEWYESELQSVQLTGCKLSYVNFRGSTLSDLDVVSCEIDELDLANVRAERVRFTDCRVTTLHLQHARLDDVDLRGLQIDGAISGLEAMRGAVITPAQATTLVEAFTAHLGITVQD